MIAMLTGQIVHKSPDHIIINVNGVGYLVQIPFSTYYDLPEKGDACLHIHTNVREDANHLYGFRTRLEKSFFQLLTSVSGVGPKLARDILSNIQPSQLTQALTHGNISALSSIPGIGKKTAERLILELKEKAGKLDATSSQTPKQQQVQDNELVDDVVSALLNLGYKEAHVRKAIAGLVPEPDTSVENLLKQALKLLMK